MSTEVKGRRVESFDDLKSPGDFMFDVDEQSLIYMCPSGCGAIGSLRLNVKDVKPSWDWDGDREKPTLTPSIRKTSGCEWHGFLTDGVFKPC